MNGIALRTAAIFIVVFALDACASSERRAPADIPPQSAIGVPAHRLVEVANSLLEREQYREAARLFGQALEKEPDHVGARLGVAEAYLGTGAASAAMPAFAALADVPAVKVAAAQGQGVSLLLLGQTDKAQEVLEAVVGAEPSAWRAWNALGRCYDLKQRWDDAARAYAMALGLKPDAYIVHNNLGMSLLSQARHGEAEAKFLDALTLRPDFEVSRNNLRFALALQGRYRDAFAGAARHDLPTVLNNVGYAALLRGENGRAQAYFSRAMEASPHFMEVAYENLRRAKGRAGSED